MTEYIKGNTTLKTWTDKPGTVVTGASDEWLAADWNNALKHANWYANVMDYGAVGDGSTNDYTAIAAALTAGGVVGNGLVIFPNGTFCTNTMLAMPNNVSIQMAPGASIKATAAMEAVLQTPLLSLTEEQTIRGGHIYCNSLANAGIDIQWGRGNRVEDVCVEDFLVAGFRLGAAGAGGNSFENRIVNCRTMRRVASVVANSIACHCRTSTDNIVSDCVFQGGETGVQCDATSGGNMFTNVHTWVNLGRMKYGFNDLGNTNTWTNCYADTPSVYAFWLQGQYTNILGGKHYGNNQVGVDNVAIGVRFEQANPVACVVGLTISAQDNTHRIAQDFSFASSSANVTLLANPTNNVVVTTPSQTSNALKSQSSGSYRGMTVFDAAGQNRQVVFETSSGGAGVGSRAILEVDNVAESGANAGSNFRLLLVADDGVTTTELLRGTRSTGALGFFNSAGAAKQTVTGSKGANAALTSLITALANLGLITDSTT